MKRDNLYSCLCGGLLAFCIGFGGVACMVTGLNLSAQLPVLAMGCAIGAAAAAICFYFKRGGLYLLGFSLLWGCLLIFSDEFKLEAGGMAAHILSYYNRAYGIVIPDALIGVKALTHQQPLMVIGWIVSALCCRTVCQAKGAAVTVIAAVLPLAACLVVTDTVPDNLWLYLLLFGLSLLLMTQILRRRAPAQAPKLTAMLAGPLAILLLVMFLFIPRDSYSPPDMDGTLDSLLSWMEQKIPHVDQTSDGELVIRFNNITKKEVDLSAQGSRRERETPVMEVKSSFGGTLYLRERHYTGYDGRTWLASEEVTEALGPYDIWVNPPSTVTVRTYGAHSTLYLPYYSAGRQQLVDGRVENTNRITQYTMDVSRLRDNWQDAWRSLFGMMSPDLPFLSYSSYYDPTAEDPYAAYLELPDATLERAQTLLRTFLPPTAEADTVEVAELVESHVRSSARYDLNPGRMPEGEDFALWFLESSDKGYCVHFASAAVVLLRAAGIPARYVEGYTVEVKADQTTIVREKMGHAWAEYYVSGLGWVILDPTPAAADTPEDTTAPIQKPTEPTESTTAPPPEPSETQPAQTEPATEPSGPHQEAPQEPPEWLAPLLIWLAVLTATAVLIWGQWYLRRRQILQAQRSGSSNARALARWRETARLCRLLKQKPPEELRTLAEKAKFSQHAITAEELAHFTAAQQELVRQLRSNPWYRRLVYRLIFAAY